MKIEKIIINNFKIFQKQTICLSEKENETSKERDFIILVGNNGTGKSTLLEAIHLALTGFYRGKSIVGNLTQDLFNKNSVDSFLKEFNEEKNPIPPSISIEVFFDEEPVLEGDFNSIRSKACGFLFEITYDERNNDAYSELKNHLPLNTLPIEFYKCEWTTFARKSYTNSKFIPFKSAFLNSGIDRYGDYSSKLIKSYIDDASKIELNQSFRKVTDDLKHSDSFKRINEKIKTSDSLKEKNISIGVTNSSQNAWETAITIKENEIPYDNLGTGKQRIVNTILSFENEVFKNKGIILIEEPENHLSGMSLNLLLSYIKTHCSGHQVVISTHSSFVLNKLGMNNLLLIGNNAITRFNELAPETTHYFERVSGFDTLRFILSTKTILVEGGSDDLIIQRAYYDESEKLPINDGVEIIDVGLSFDRFLDIASKLGLKTAVITDNDGNMDRINKLKEKYLKFPFINIFCGEKVYKHTDLGLSDDEVPNVNTLEPEIARSNKIDALNKIFNTDYKTNEELIHYMISNKTEVAWKIFNSKEKIVYPNYINKAIEFIKKEVIDNE